MQLRNRLSNLFQKETSRLFKSFLDDNPDLLQKYISGGVATVGTILKPVNVFMRHLLIVQGLDPDSVPGEKQRELLREALNSLMSETHEEDFEADYNLDWVQKKFEETRGKLAQLELSKEKFMSLTDLANLPMDSLPAINKVPDELPKKEIPVFDPGNPIDALREAVKAVEKEVNLDKKKRLKISKKKLNKVQEVKRGKGTKVLRTNNPEIIEGDISSLECKAEVRPPTKRQPGRNLNEIARNRRDKAKAAKEASPKVQEDLKIRLARATKLTDLMIEKGFIDPKEQAREDQITSMLTWSDSNFDSLERVIAKYAPTKDAVAENKFKGSFRRIVK